MTRASNAILAAIVGLTCVPLSASPVKSAPACAVAETPAEKLMCGDIDSMQLHAEAERLYALAAKSIEKGSGDEKALQELQMQFVTSRDICESAADPKECIRDHHAAYIFTLRSNHFAARQRDNEGISSGPFVLECGDNALSMAVTFLNTDTPMLLAETPQMLSTFRLAPSGSGAKYRNDAGTSEIWLKGDEGLFVRQYRGEWQCKLKKTG